MNKESSRGGQKRDAEEVFRVPTLGQVVAEDGFGPLRELIQPLAPRPVSEVSDGMRTALLKRGGEQLELPLHAFFSACDAHVREIERKRAHVDAGQRVQGA